VPSQSSIAVPPQTPAQSKLAVHSSSLQEEKYNNENITAVKKQINFKLYMVVYCWVKYTGKFF